MKQNMGTIDKVLRVLLGVLITALYVTGVISGASAMMLLAGAIVFLATSAIGSCPLYSVCRISTRKQSNKNKEA
ncbi:MAG: DUF2892 domain-containing protein [Bacteroidetes bacterium]|nr:MAG: DUF2892 domain-containing protein [Bacteroidota bacterium]